MKASRSLFVTAIMVLSIASLAGSVAHAKMVGGDPELCSPFAATTGPALFDTDGVQGPSLNDEPAYITTIIPQRAPDGSGRMPLGADIHHPNDVCFDPSSASIVFEDSGAVPGKNLWPGVYDTVLIPSINGAFIFDQQNGDAQAIGGTFTQTMSQTKNFALSLEASTRASYSRVNVGGDLTTSGGILGWDMEPADGVVDYIGLSWAGMGGFQPCEGKAGTLDDSFMLWLPVEPHPTVAGAVVIKTDFDCDGQDDGIFPPCPPIIPESTTPVELSSFTVASARSIVPKGIAFIGLAAVVLLPGVRFARRWLPGLDI